MTSKKKKLSENQFQEAVNNLNIGQQTIDIAYGVLVQGKLQASFVAMLGLSRGAISQAVNRVWAVYAAQDCPKGYERVMAVLPENKAFIVRKWAEQAEKKLELKR